MTIKLKPCPFCGTMPIVLDCNINITPHWVEQSAAIQCINCGAKIEKNWFEHNLQENEFFLNNDTVFDLWNRRVDNA